MDFIYSCIEERIGGFRVTFICLIVFIVQVTVFLLKWFQIYDVGSCEILRKWIFL